MDIPSLQRPLKDQYRQDPASSRITLTARGQQTDAPTSCPAKDEAASCLHNALAHLAYNEPLRK
jgi:hypothetical protein